MAHRTALVSRIKGRPNFLQHTLRQKGRDRISKLRLNAGPSSDQFEAIRKGEETLHLRHAQPAVLPVKWSYIRPWLRLNSGRWLIWVELK